MSAVTDAKGVLPKGEIEKPADHIVIVCKHRYPGTAQHIEDAQKEEPKPQYPSVLTVDRAGADDRRAAATGPYATKDYYDRDEYPPAMFKEGGKGAHVAWVAAPDNRGAGSSIGHQVRKLNLQEGETVEIRVVSDPENDNPGCPKCLCQSVNEKLKHQDKGYKEATLLKAETV